ncbi:hypothetical protein [Methylobacterium crusticola]|nr:hypothetical protein [Methylobacterium crusticola]
MTDEKVPWLKAGKLGRVHPLNWKGVAASIALLLVLMAGSVAEGALRE